MKCRKCGAQIDDDSRYCDQCRARQYAGKEMKQWSLVISVIMLTVGIALGLFLPDRCSKGNVDTNQLDTVGETIEQENAATTNANETKSDSTGLDNSKQKPGVQQTLDDDYWVDLGLPGGLLWAKCNLGASNPEQYGNYYAWGETKPKNNYTWSTYRYATVDSDGNLKTLTKYNFEAKYGTTDGKRKLESANDAAAATLGKGARMPTQTEWQDLLNNTTSEWTTINGTKGRLFTSKINGKTLFLPAAGDRNGTELYHAGACGYYWLSSLDEGMTDYAKGLYIVSYGHDVGHYSGFRSSGQSVRAVHSKIIEKSRPEYEYEGIVIPEVSPKFPGGEEKLYEYISENVRYPDLARDAGITGRVIVQFSVEKDGSITDVKVVRDIGGGCGDELARVVRSMPKWKPGLVGGRPVKSQLQLPMNFTLK